MDYSFIMVRTILFDSLLDFKYPEGDLNMHIELVQAEPFIINHDSLEKRFKNHRAEVKFLFCTFTRFRTTLTH